ncbi:MAG: hypothetical protein IJK89_03815 [Clostridia bacterium]|nr:hypothetical protein [Clostridia bacterium]
MNKRFLKMLSVLLTAVMLIATASVAFAADPALPGSGTKDDPYRVSNLDDIWELVDCTSDYDGKYIVLVNDLSLGGETLEPIGTEDEPFKGIFDGCGYTVGNFKMGNNDYCGLFGCSEDASIGNVTIKNATFTCANSSNVGLLAGYAVNTSISNVVTENCTIEAASNAGGIVGTIKDGKVSDCVNGCSVTLITGNESGPNAGGIAGSAKDSQILRCINTADVSGNYQKNIGGIVGSLQGTVSHCLNKGLISSNVLNQSDASNSGIAGIAGAAGGSIEYCGNAGLVSSGSDCAGIFSVADGLSVSYCYNAGVIACNDNFKEKSDTIGLGAEVEHCIGVGGDITTDDLQRKAIYDDDGWDFETVWCEPGNYHGYVYPMLLDCSFHKMKKTSNEATCTSDGGINYVCDDPQTQCSFSHFAMTQAALGHQKVVKNTVPANCTVEGEKTYKCKRCGEDLPDETEVLPIDPNKHVDEDGDNICDLCKKTIKQEETKRNFFQKIGDFFKRIFDWIRNLFKKK